MKKLRYNQDENPTNNDEIKLAEEIWGNEFPKEYRTFLLQHNGGEIYPNIPTIKATTEWELWGIERFCSVGDLILQKKYPMGYTWYNQHEEEVLKVFNVSTKDLMTIAVAERGCYYLNLSENDYGQIYFACYQDWDGFVKLQTKSFNEYLDSLKPYPDSDFFDFEMTRKIYDSRFFQTPEKPQLGIERFKEVLSFLGDANSKSRDSDWTVIQHYAYVNPFDKMGNYIFEYLLENGGKTEGLLLRTKNFNIIMKLINDYNVDINEPYNGKYPIHWLTSISSWSTIKENYELLDKLLNSNIKIDLSVKGSQGETVKESLKQMVVEYEKYREYDKNFGKSKPENHKFLTSKKINELIGAETSKSNWLVSILKRNNES